MTRLYRHDYPYGYQVMPRWWAWVVRRFGAWHDTTIVFRGDTYYGDK